jgi:hypothetical protein
MRQRAATWKVAEDFCVVGGCRLVEYGRSHTQNGSMATGELLCANHIRPEWPSVVKSNHRSERAAPLEKPVDG